MPQLDKQECGTAACPVIAGVTRLLSCSFKTLFTSNFAKSANSLAILRRNSINIYHILFMCSNRFQLNHFYTTYFPIVINQKIKAEHKFSSSPPPPPSPSFPFSSTITSFARKNSWNFALQTLPWLPFTSSPHLSRSLSLLISLSLLSCFDFLRCTIDVLLGTGKFMRNLPVA